MSTIPKEKLDRLVERWQSIQTELNAGPAQARFVALSKEFAELDPIVSTINEPPENTATGSPCQQSR